MTPRTAAMLQELTGDIPPNKVLARALEHYVEHVIRKERAFGTRRHPFLRRRGWRDTRTAGVSRMDWMLDRLPSTHQPPADSTPGA